MPRGMAKAEYDPGWKIQRPISVVDTLTPMYYTGHKNQVKIIIIYQNSNLEQIKLLLQWIFLELLTTLKHKHVFVYIEKLQLFLGAQYLRENV